jgi:hypothetical protein
MSHPSSDEVLHAALDLATRRGWRVFPVGDDKRPFKGSHGFKDATADPDAIRRLFCKHPSSNLAVATGPDSGVWVLDLDCKGGLDGLAELTKLESAHEALPPTITQRTPTGGWQRFFKWNGVAIRNSESVIAPGVDVRGRGGYAVVAPSVLRKQTAARDGKDYPGGRYEWAGDGDPGAAPAFELAEPPAWLVELASKPPKKEGPTTPGGDRGREFEGGLRPYVQSAVDAILAGLRRAPVGERNSALNVAAVKLGHWVLKYVNRPDAEARLRHVALQLGLDLREISATVDSGLRKGEQEPREIPEGKRARSNGDAPSDEAGRGEHATGAGLGEWDAADDDVEIPPRGWLLGTTFCRRFVSSLIGAGGGGKTALRITQALALATGRELTREHVFRRTRVLLVTAEDDADELRRRVRAARLHFNIPREEVAGWLFLASIAEAGWKVAEVDQDGSVRRGEMAERLEAVIVRRKIDLLMIPVRQIARRRRKQ